MLLFVLFSEDTKQALKNAVADAEWEEKIRRCQESGLTVQEWCNLNKVNIKTYYYHLRRTREKIVEQIPVPIGTTSQIHKEEPEIKIRIGEAVIKIPDGMSEQTISTVLRVLKC